MKITTTFEVKIIITSEIKNHHFLSTSEVKNDDGHRKSVFIFSLNAMKTDTFFTAREFLIALNTMKTGSAEENLRLIYRSSIISMYRYTDIPVHRHDIINACINIPIDILIYHCIIVS